jgi:hypothetical protein
MSQGSVYLLYLFLTVSATLAIYVYALSNGLTVSARRETAYISPGVRGRVESDMSDTQVIIYNKPWKTGSTAVFRTLSTCLAELGFVTLGGTLGKAAWELQLPSGGRTFSGLHMLLAPQVHAAVRNSKKVCSITSLRDPGSRVPSHLIQLTYKNQTNMSISLSDREQAICENVGQLDPNFQLRYQLGKDESEELKKWDTELSESMDLYDYIIEDGEVRRNWNAHGNCDTVKSCVERKYELDNVKGTPNVGNLSCFPSIRRIVNAEYLYYNTVRNITRDWEVVFSRT